MDNLRLLAPHRVRRPSGSAILVTEDNWGRANDARDPGRRRGRRLHPVPPDDPVRAGRPPGAVEDTAWIDKAMPFLEERGRRWPHVELDLERFRMYRGWAGHGYRTCWWSVLQTCITPNGKVWVCVNKREHPAAEIGDLSRGVVR
jgi:hypothetical protein